MFLEKSEIPGEEYYFYFEKNENNISAFEVIKEIIADDEECKILPEFIGTEEEIENFPDENSHIPKHNVVKWNLDIEELKNIEPSHYVYKFFSLFL